MYRGKKVIEQTPGRQEQTSPSNLLAKERNREAAERTLLAWIRTSLSLISFGFAIYKIVQAFSEAGAQRHPMTVLLGLCFILLGIFAVGGATIQHFKILKELHLEDDPYRPKQPLGLFVAAALTGIGLLALITVLVEFFVLKK
jgi:putative membrane protein